MLNIACVKAGTKYTSEQVNILFDMVRRNLAEGFEGRFVCFTDDPDGLAEGIHIEKLPEGLNGWWNKLYLFSADAFPAGNRVVFMDLDTVIVGRLDDLVRYSGPFAILRDFYRPMGWQSAFMAWEAGTLTYVWESWLENGKPEPIGGDQEWIEEVVPCAHIWQDQFPGAFVSYKLLKGYPPREAKVVIFHGEPKPDNCGADWVQTVYKMNGGSAQELEVVCNTRDESLRSNMRAALTRNLPTVQFNREAHGRHAVIVGGGPSLADTLDEIRWRQWAGQTIFATNNTFAWLKERGITADAQVFLDARQDNVRFVQKGEHTVYLCSQCHPDLFDAADNAVMWHVNTDVAHEVLDDQPGETTFISGGSTVVLNAMCLAYALGYRELHLYGVDSSYRENQHHAYAQPLNDRDERVQALCEGRTFWVAPWMAQQVYQFQEIAPSLAEGGCTITVHGDGLLPWVARHLDTREDVSAVEIDGDLWPSKDRHCRESLRHAISDVDVWLAHTPKRGLAVQAGGNVGMVPRKLSQFFDKVVTFEPDGLNFHCLQHNAPMVEAHPFALGAQAEQKGLAKDPLNCGAHYLADGGAIPVIPLDCMELSPDLLQLDVEGYELEALKGAEQTIARSSPTIVLELKGLGERYGYADQDVVAWLAARGYQEAARAGRDVVFTKGTV